MSLKDKEKWDSKYSSEDSVASREPCSWLTENREALPGKGRALDLAMGEGRNAIFAASLGYDVLGVDISAVGARNAESFAQQKGVSIETEVVDLDTWSLPKNAFELVICFYFLDRKLFPAIRDSLKPGGLVVYETFNTDHLKYSGLKPEWVLSHGELLNAFADYRILHYRETDDHDDEKGTASILARKPDEDAK